MTESTSVRKISDWDVPSVRNVGRKAAAATSPMVTTTQVRRGWRPTAWATRAQPSLFASRFSSESGSESCRGMLGQKIQRRPRTSIAGRKVRAER